MRPVILLLLLCGSVWGEMRTLDVAPGLVEIRLEYGDEFLSGDSVIDWEARDPLDLTYKTYEKDTVFVMSAEPGARYIVASDALNWDLRKRDKITWIINVSSPNPPPPDPTPDPTPDPDPIPEPTPAAPFPTTEPGLHVLILYEGQPTDDEHMPPSQLSIFTSAKVRQWLEANTTAHRVWDDDFTLEQMAHAPPTFRDAYGLVLEQSRGVVPWIAISDGQTGFTGPLPESIDALIQLLEQYGD